MQEKHYTVDLTDAQLEVLDIQPEGRPSSPAIVFLHDALGSIRQWKDFPHLIVERTGLRALLYNRRGHGGSSPLSANRTPGYLHREATEELPALLRKVEIENPILFGHSDGGSIALIYAAHFSTAALITEAAHVIVEDRTIRGIRMASRERYHLLNALRKYHGEQTEALFDAWTDTWLDPGFRDWDILDLLPRIKCPALIIQGADDEYGTEEQVWAAATGIGPQSKALLISNCGHIPHREAPEKIIDQVTKFIVDYSGD